MNMYRNEKERSRGTIFVVEFSVVREKGGME